MFCEAVEVPQLFVTVRLTSTVVVTEGNSSAVIFALGLTILTC